MWTGTSIYPNLLSQIEGHSVCNEPSKFHKNDQLDEGAHNLTYFHAELNRYAMSCADQESSTNPSVSELLAF